MSDFNDIIDEILETPPSPPYLPPRPQLPPPPPPPASAPSAPSAPAVPALAPLGRLSRPSCRPPVASSGDIWDIPSDEELLEEDGDAPASGPGYVIQYTNAVFNGHS